MMEDYARGQDGGSAGQRNRMAVAIDYKAQPKMSQAPADPTLPVDIESLHVVGASTGKDGLQSDSMHAGPRLEDAADPEEALLLYVLQKMK